MNKIGHGARAPPPCMADKILSLLMNNLSFPGLHELDPVFRKVTLQNERLKALVRDLRFHKDPVGV